RPRSENRVGSYRDSVMEIFQPHFVNYFLHSYVFFLSVWYIFILCTTENLSINEQDCGLYFSIRLTGDTRIA
ncbi:MAG: hypothetical protein WCI51_08410, partial [Lentisphaerota bacterium]